MKQQNTNRTNNGISAANANKHTVTVQEIVKDIKDTFGGSSFLNATQVGLVLNMAKDKRGKFLADVPCYKTGKEKKYHVLDIARKMDSIKTYIPYG